MENDDSNIFPTPPTNKIDFSNIGGLKEQIEILRDVIILPLLHKNLFNYFHIKAPRGVLFHGPPGTGKTLVAGALANELQKRTKVPVNFYQRKGADILDKWIGESERHLRELFQHAAMTRPSIIFFDELDGLAPVRSPRNEHIHSSIVTTLLALMDGLDSNSGVIVIGATNRIDDIDPALRRPGRFDRELYFPPPNILSRREILKVHTKEWKFPPNDDLLNTLSELTCGYCGSDLQALCTEAVLQCLRRTYPDICHESRNIDMHSLQVRDSDFINARHTITPALYRVGCIRAHRLSLFMKPLLDRQLKTIIDKIHRVWPHFLDPHRKYVIGLDRYVGKLLIKGTSQQGLYTYIIPAIFQTLEHLPHYIIDVTTSISKTINSCLHTFPCMVVLPKVDEWWDDIVDEKDQFAILSMFDNLNYGLPILVIVTFREEIPANFADYMCNSVQITLDNPSREERKRFFAPLFFGGVTPNAIDVWRNRQPESSTKSESNKSNYKCLDEFKAKQRDKKLRRLKRAIRAYKKSRNLLEHVSKKCLSDPATVNNKGSASQGIVNEGNDMNKKDLDALLALGLNRCVEITQGLSVMQIESLYDRLFLCIQQNSNDFATLIIEIKATFEDFKDTIRRRKQN